MTSLYLPSMTSQPSLSSIALPASPVTTAGSDAYTPPYFSNEELLVSHVRVFWSSFPCPPPWRPSLLTEVNSSKLGPQMTRIVTSFLVGKCRTDAAGYPGTRIGSGFGFGDGDDDDDFDDDGGGGGGGGVLGPNAESHLPESSDALQWCNRTCQLAIGCSAVLMAMLVATVALVCFTRVRRPHKMAATRPSRQQLQLSTSTSDPINWAEFSNTQIQFDDDMVYPPFRHRGLPSPPSQCHHPSCDPKWNCPTCSSCHPLMMRISPSGGTATTCSHGYAAVYETIDDDDDDVTTGTAASAGTLPYRLTNYHANETLQNRENGAIETDSSCSNICYRKSSSTPPNDLSRPEDRREAETGFNGEEGVHRWPKYFELDGNLQDHGVLFNASTALGSPRIAGMKSFQNPPHQESSWGFHPVLAPNTFGKSPHPHPHHHLSAQTMPGAACGQLCATCVPNVVSMVPCVNISRQNGYIPNGKAHNISSSPYQQATMCVSSVENNPHHCHNTYNQPQQQPPPPQLSSSSSAHNKSVIGVDGRQTETRPVDDEARLTESQYFFNQGCDLAGGAQYENNSQPLTQIPGIIRRPSNGSSQLESTQMWPGVPANADSHSQESESLPSPSRHWCPTCQQVPLLDHRSAHRNSTCARSDVGTRHSSCDGDHGVSADDCHQGLCDCQPDSPRHAFVDASDISEGNPAAEASGNGTQPEGNSRHDYKSDSTRKSWPQESPRDSMTSNEIQNAKNDNCSSPTRNNLIQPCPRVLALHSRYFNKTSKA